MFCNSEKVLFLDALGVICSPQWQKLSNEKYVINSCGNNFQAAQWVSEFCSKYGYSIVIISSWREFDDVEERYRETGIRDDVQIIGKIPSLPDDDRGKEISMWLAENPETKEYVIFDDDPIEGHEKNQIVTNFMLGFTAVDYDAACELIKNRK